MLGTAFCSGQDFLIRMRLITWVWGGGGKRMIVQSQWKSSSVGGLFSISCDLEGICDENNFRVTNCFGG